MLSGFDCLFHEGDSLHEEAHFLCWTLSPQVLTGSCCLATVLCFLFISLLSREALCFLTKLWSLVPRLLAPVLLGLGCLWVFSEGVNGVTVYSDTLGKPRGQSGKCASSSSFLRVPAYVLLLTEKLGLLNLVK